MDQRQRCHQKDMVAFLLALCCKNHSAAPVSRNEDLSKQFDSCYESIIPIANDVKLKEKLDN
jgi:hypothetical protein